MNDAEFIAELSTITDPKAMLRMLVENWTFIGTDPYYRHLNDALYENTERVASAE